MPRHLLRLTHIWQRQPLYFVTTCVAARRQLLAGPVAHAILREEWHGWRSRHGWLVGRYVVMPDHVHLFATPEPNTERTLSWVMGAWKEWTAKRLLARLREPAPLWQEEFFDHVLRSKESYAEKWEYVRNNPVRAGLVAKAEDWPYAGSVHFE
jgi:REP element-mobilizing transposase RayT